MGDSPAFCASPGLFEDLRRDDETVEPLLKDRGHILQKREGYRFSLDAVVLADFAARLRGKARAGKSTRYLDLGTGCGIILVLLAKWGSGLTGYGVEIQEALAELAGRNLRLHGLEDRFQVLCTNLTDLPSRLPPASFDWITSNPPYRRLETGRINPDPQKALARHEIAASLEDLCRVMAYLLREKGRAFLVYPAGRFAGLVARLREAGLEPKTARPVYPKPGERASWVLVEAVRNGKEELSIERPLFVEDAQGEYSEEMNQIFRWEF
ncbi:MAG: tRNA1(Val) (adenine(37)-N6)-methyltransferase [Thermodesulfobacteriota bacterium]